MVKTPTVVVRIVGTLGKYDQRRLWKLICIVNPFYLLFKKKKSQKSNLSLDNKNLKSGKISLWNKCFSLKYTLDTNIGSLRNSYE